MENEFVLYNEALKLKELGFDEPCFGFYRSSEDILPTIELITRISSIKNLNNRGMRVEILAPTYSQAFRFFREKYKMIHQIYSLKYKGGVNYDYEIFSLVLPTDDELGNEDDVATDKSMETYDSLVDKNFKHDESETYEDAEFDCLQKLIEIVNKNI
jgi:hypothetical protein